MPSKEPPRGRDRGVRELSTYYRALADNTRLRIMRTLWQRNEGTVTELCDELRVSQPLMSWHLRILRRSGLVTTYRTGRQVHCGLGPDVLSDNGSLLANFLASEVDAEPIASAVPSEIAEPYRASKPLSRYSKRPPITNLPEESIV